MNQFSSMPAKQRAMLMGLEWRDYGMDFQKGQAKLR